jgi:hypothetical protein
VQLIDGKVPASAEKMTSLAVVFDWTASGVNGLANYTWTQAAVGCENP